VVYSLPTLFGLGDPVPAAIITVPDERVDSETVSSSSGLASWTVVKVVAGQTSGGSMGTAYPLAAMVSPLDMLGFCW